MTLVNCCGATKHLGYLCWQSPVCLRDPTKAANWYSALAEAASIFSKSLAKSLLILASKGLRVSAGFSKTWQTITLAQSSVSSSRAELNKVSNFSISTSLFLQIKQIIFKGLFSSYKKQCYFYNNSINFTSLSRYEPSTLRS